MSAPIISDSIAIPGISGVYVDDTFYPSDTTGTYSHKVDYFNGRIIFDNAIASTSKVQAEFSYKYSKTWFMLVIYLGYEKFSTER